MDTQSLKAEVREQSGKGAARQLRMSGRLPGVFYGKTAEPVALSVSPKDLLQVLSTDWRRNVLLQLEVGGDQQPAMVKDLQVHPVSREPLHVDFYKVDPKTPVKVQVPFKTKGRAKGVIRGGKLKAVFRELPVSAAPENIPAAIVADVANLDIGDGLQVKDLQLPEGVSVELQPERNVVLLGTERKRKGKGGAEEEEAAAAT